MDDVNIGSWKKLLKTPHEETVKKWNDLDNPNLAIGILNDYYKASIVKDGHTPTAHWNDTGFARRQIALSEMEGDMYDREFSDVPHPDGVWADRIEEPDVRLEVGYRTGSGNVFSLTIDCFELNKTDIPTMTLYETMAACGTCRGSNGGCPGFAPLFYRNRQPNFFLCIVHIDMAWSLHYAGGWKRKPGILRAMTWPDRLTDSYVNRLRKWMNANGAGMGLSVGNCNGCNPQKCGVTLRGVCDTPHKRSFSMEATGVDCDAVHYQLYKEILPWYYAGTGMLPTYMSRYFGFYSDGTINYMQMIADAVQSDWSLHDIDDVPELPDIPVTKIKIPRGIHKGMSQYVYSKSGS